MILHLELPYVTYAPVLPIYVCEGTIKRRSLARLHHGRNGYEANSHDLPDRVLSAFDSDVATNDI